jgi:hypothetical protein
MPPLRPLRSLQELSTCLLYLPSPFQNTRLGRLQYPENGAELCLAGRIPDDEPEIAV